LIIITLAEFWSDWLVIRCATPRLSVS